MELAWWQARSWSNHMDSVHSQELKYETLHLPSGPIEAVKVEPDKKVMSSRYAFGISCISGHVWLKGAKHSNSANDINNDIITQMTSPHPKSYKRSVCSKINRYSN